MKKAAPRDDIGIEKTDGVKRETEERFRQLADNIHEIFWGDARDHRLRPPTAVLPSENSRKSWGKTLRHAERGRK